MFKHRVYHVGGKRSHVRINCRIPVDYVVNQQVHRDFIENISPKGVYIGTNRSMPLGAEVVMTFLWQGHTGLPIKSSGKVVRSTANGFAVLFNDPITIH